MNTLVIFATVLAAACAAPSGIVSINKVGYGTSKLVRAPAHDSASIESHRLGGNFAYATAEAHAYASITPEISEAVHPVAETTYTHQPAPIAHVQPAPIVKTHHAARPIIGQKPVYAQQPVVGPVRKHTIVEQPIYKQQHISVHQPQVAIQKTAVVGVAAAPAIKAIGVAAAPAVAAYGAAPAVAAYGAAPAVAAYGAAPAVAAGYGAAIPAGYGAAVPAKY